MNVKIPKQVAVELYAQYALSEGPYRVLLQSLNLDVGSLEITNSNDMYLLLLVLDDLYSLKANNRDRFQRAVAAKIDKLIAKIKSMSPGTEFAEAVERFDQRD